MATRYSGWLATYQAALKRHVAGIDAFGADMVELDIRRRNYANRSPLKASTQTEVVTQDTTYLAPADDNGHLLAAD